MKAVIQRVSRGSVSIGGKEITQIRSGYLILLGVCEGDTEKDSDLLAEKIVHLRLMSDPQGKINLSIKDVNGEILVVSQFTLCADIKGGRRPSFIHAAKPDIAKAFYLTFVKQLQLLGIQTVVTGEFGAHMEVELVNDGPVTIIVDTKEL
jgi:D-tyrosyl-tRNA(Tyr) deacylase